MKSFLKRAILNGWKSIVLDLSLMICNLGFYLSDHSKLWLSFAGVMTLILAYDMWNASRK